MFGARVETSFAGGKASATLWYDYLSGDDPETAEVELFHTLYAANRKFYGFADLFLNSPVHTGGAGLQDLALKLDWQPEADVRLAADLHRFRTAQGKVLASDDFGTELDLTISHRYSAHLTATAGLSRVWTGDALVELGRPSKDMTWFYVMLDARF
ncbi:MAG: alginate export family protein [Gemmatimonadota bacterium]